MRHDPKHRRRLTTAITPSIRPDASDDRHLLNGFLAGAALVAALLGSAGQARSAGCLTGADLHGGVRAIYLDGSVVDYSHAGEGLVRVVERPDPAAPEAIAFLARYGLYDLEAQAMTGDSANVGQHLRYSYATADGTEPPQPVAGETWLGQSVTTYADGASDVADAVIVFGRAGQVSLGGCDYRSIPVTASFLMGEAWASQDYEWLPDLGIGLLTGRQGSDAARGSAYRLSGLTRIAGQ